MVRHPVWALMAWPLLTAHRRAANQANRGGVCVYVEESAEWIAKVAAPAFVTVLQYNYTTTVGEWHQYAGLSTKELEDRLLMTLPRYAWRPSPRTAPRSRLPPHGDTLGVFVA